MALPLEQRGVKRRRNQALSYHEGSSGLSLHSNTKPRKLLEDKIHGNKTQAQAGCPDECPFRQVALDEEDIRPEFPEPEGDDGSLNDVAQRLYTRINSLWQTRILRLMPGPLGSALSGDLLVADIVLLPGLVLHDEGRLVSFRALSYCCGEGVLTRRIRLNGELLPITENVYLALQMLRQGSEPIFLWVDAICIHQNLPEEKSQQVVNMFSIYRKASQVDIWLGPSSKATGIAMKFLSSATRDLIDHMRKHRRNLTTLLDGICDLLSRPWFQRIWVKQELYAASKIAVHCGSDFASGDVFSEWVTTVELLLEMQKRPRAMGIYCQTLRSFRRAKPGELIERELPEQPNGNQAQEFHLDIVNVLKRCAGSQCSQPQDHIYAILGMTDVKHRARSAGHMNDEALVIDYTKSTADTFADVTRHVIRRDQNLAVLHLDAVCGPSDSKIELPSWVPDFRFKQRPLLRYFYYKGQHDHQSLRELFDLATDLFCDKEMLPFDLGSHGQQSSRLVVTGRRIGTLVPDKTPWNVGWYQIPEHRCWNIFHERHIYRHGIPERLISQTERTEVAEVSATDLATISIAVHLSTHRYRGPAMDREMGRNKKMRCILVKLMWKKNLFCSVVVSWKSGQYFDPLWSVVNPDQYRFVQCLYTEDIFEQLEYLGDPPAWIVPRNAKKDDLLIAAIGSPFPIIVRPHSSTLTWRYIGSAVPCQMKITEPLPSETMSRVKPRKSDRCMGLLEEFILE